MDNLESSILDLVSSTLELNKKREIRVGDLNGLARKAEDLKGSFIFAKRLLNELSHEGTESVEKLRRVEQEYSKEKKDHEQDIERYEDKINVLSEDIEKKNNKINELTNENNDLLKERNGIKVKLSNSQETCTLLREELQKAHLTCTTYEEQIIRLNEQLSLEAIEKQTNGDFYEKKVQDLEERVETMEEGMYDPEAYYCLERDRFLEENSRLEEEMQSVSLTSQKKDFLLNQKTQECERLTKQIEQLQQEVREFAELKLRSEKMESELSELWTTMDTNKRLQEEVEELRSKVNDKDKEHLLEDIATSNALIADLNNQITQLKHQVEEREEENNKQEQMILNQKVSIDLNQEQMERLNGLLDERLKELEQMRTIQSETETRMKTLEQQLIDLQQEKEKAVEECKEKISQLSEMSAQKDADALMDDLEDDSYFELEAELKKSERMIAELEQKMMTVEAEALKRQERITELEEQFQACQVREKRLLLKLEGNESQEMQERCAALTEDLTRMKEQYEEIKKEKEELMERMTELDTQCKQLNEQRELEKNPSTQWAEEKTELEKKVAEKEQLQTEKAALEERMQAEKMQWINKLDEAKNALQEQQALFSHQLEDVKAQHAEKINVLERQSAELLQDKQAMEETILKLEKQVADVLAEKETMASQLVEIEQQKVFVETEKETSMTALAEQNRMVENELNALKMETEKQAEVVVGLNHQVMTLTAEIDALNTQLLSTHEVNKQNEQANLELERQVTEKVKENEALEAENDLLRKQLEEQSQALNDQTAQLELVKRQCEEALEENQTRVQSVNELTQQRNDLSLQLKAMVTQSELKEAKEKEMEEALEEAKQQIETYKQTIAEIQQLEERCNELEKEVRVAPTHSSPVEGSVNDLILEKLRKENEMLNKRVLELIHSREAAEKQVYSLESTVAFLKSTVESREKENEVLACSLKEKNVLIGQLKGQLVRYQCCVCFSSSHTCINKQDIAVECR